MLEAVLKGSELNGRLTAEQVSNVQYIYYVCMVILYI